MDTTIRTRTTSLMIKSVNEAETDSQSLGYISSYMNMHAAISSEDKVA